MRTWLFVAVALLAVGCGSPKNGDDSKADVVPGPDRSQISSPPKLPLPDLTTRTTLRMVRRGDELRVGDSADDALRVYKEEKNAFKLSDMPPGWRDEDYKCIGWDTGSVGFGALTYNDHVALALYHEDRMKEDRLQDILDTYERQTAIVPFQISGSRVRYWFWDEAPQRLMICAVSTPSESTLNVAIALGDDTLMDLFRMNKDMALKDKDLAEDLFREGLNAKRDQSEKP